MKNKLYIAIFSAVFIILSIILYGKSGNMMIDFSREAYIPYQMLTGSKLCKDIFLIYGGFGYFINMLLYKISVNINLILIEALIVAYMISVLLYYILKKFTSDIIAFIFTLFFIIVSVFSNSNFSFAVPYSYSTIWAVFGLYLLLFSVIYRFDKLKYVILGFIFINKIEFFILSFLFILIFDIIKKKFSTKNYLLILIFPLISLLFIDFSSLFNNFSYISAMTQTKALKYMYKGMGSLFMGEYFIFNLKYLAIYLIVSAISYFVFKKNKVISIIILSVLFYLIYPNIFLHLGFFAALILSVINRNKLKKRDIILLFFAVVLCSKSIFAINSLLYSNFGYALLIFYIFRQLTLAVNKNWVIWHFLLLIAFLSIGQYFDYKHYPKYSLKSEIGTIKLGYNDCELIKKVNDYIKNNLKENESIIVVPEGQIINLINKKKWDYYNSTFTPLDFETFGEDNLIRKLKENKTDYIVFFPRETREYGAKTICYDYGVDFCTYIMDNYKRVEIFENVEKALIFKIYGK